MPGVPVRATRPSAASLREPDLDAARGCALAIRRRTRVAAVYALARELVHSRGEVANDTVNPALDAGLSVSDVLEVVGECTFAGLVGTIDNLAGRVELNGYLQPRAWQAGSGGSRSMGFGKQIGSGKAPRRARPLREGPSSRVRHALSPSEDPLRNEVERGSAHA